MKKYLKLMRIRHYIKNILVFAALACSGQFFNLEKLTLGAAAFASFCMISSVVYIINDIRDVEKDRKHPTKRNRPIASGTVSEKKAWMLALLCFLAALGCNFFACNTKGLALLLLYFGLNMGYSFGLKNIPLLDVSILVTGFLIRIVYGAVVTDIVVSNWLYLTVIALSFYLALGKRRNEIKQIPDSETRQVLNKYPIAFLDKCMNMCLSLANAFYALWSMDENTIELYNSSYLIFTVPIVLLISMKYSLNVEGNSNGDPVEVLLSDKVLMALCLAYFTAMFAILYLS